MKKRKKRLLVMGAAVFGTLFVVGYQNRTEVFAAGSVTESMKNIAEAESGTGNAAETENNTGNTEERETAVKKTGWQKVKNKTYYYSKKGIKVTGWKKIKGRYYYFDKKGELQKNKIVGNKKKGYYYVDKSGVRVTTKEIKMAVAFVMKNSSVKQSPQERLKSCFWTLCNHYPYQRIISDVPSAGKIPSYAAYMFQNKRGNCYRYASSMAYIARVLGYESRVAVGGVSSSTYFSPHGWCEVKKDGKWKMYDCSIQAAYPQKQLYQIDRKAYPFRLRIDRVYNMKSKNGKISFRRTEE